MKVNWSKMTEEEKRSYFDQLKKLSSENENIKEDSNKECQKNKIL